LCNDGTDTVNTVIVTLCVCYLTSASVVCILLYADFLKNYIDRPVLLTSHSDWRGGLIV